MILLDLSYILESRKRESTEKISVTWKKEKKAWKERKIQTDDRNK